jgi:hypothetical protein
MLLIHSMLLSTKGFRKIADIKIYNVCRYRVHAKFDAKSIFQSQYCNAHRRCLLYFLQWIDTRTPNECEMKNGFSVVCGHIVDGYIIHHA